MKMKITERQFELMQGLAQQPIDTTSSQTIAKPNVSGSFFGLYSIDAELMFVHATREGAKKHQYEYEKAHGMGFYVEPVLVLD